MPWRLGVITKKNTYQSFALKQLLNSISREVASKKNDLCILGISNILINSFTYKIAIG